MIAIKRGAIQAPFDGATIANSEVIEWLSNDSSKPGKTAPKTSHPMALDMRSLRPIPCSTTFSRCAIWSRSWDQRS